MGFRGGRKKKGNENMGKSGEERLLFPIGKSLLVPPRNKQDGTFRKWNTHSVPAPQAALSPRI